MDVASAVYSLLIGPLELFFEVVYALAYRVTDNLGISIIFLSLAMNFLVLPLYRRADAMQAAERDRSLKMKPWVDHIKKTFSGDERFMMLQTYYRQNNYKQTDALKGSISLLLEIPFFIAAYHFLSNLELLRGVAFGPITDLGAPDAMLQFGDIHINLLPLLMTALNVVSAVIYLKGFPLRSKIQTYGIAAIFLVLLYASPAGLVFYWTLNNLFSLLKNLFTTFKRPGFVLSVVFAVCGVAGLVYVLLINPTCCPNGRVEVTAFFALLELPIILYAASRRLRSKVRFAPLAGVEVDTPSFTIACVFLALLTGVLIPSSVIGASPLEFVMAGSSTSPLVYLVDSACLAIGTFVIWFGIFYRLATDKGKKAFMLVSWVLVGWAVVDYLLFGTGYGTLSTSLQFDSAPNFPIQEMLVNWLVLALVAVALYAVWRWRHGVLRIVPVAACVAVVCMSGLNIATTVQQLSSTDTAAAIEQAEPRIPLSKNGKNVVVLMMDRAASVMLPALMNESPQVRAALEGFTYYPNALSYGSSTNYGSPGLYGGYEYTPAAMNARFDEPLASKHNEALKLMPALFNDEGYEVTVCDPTFAGYTWIPDLDIYDGYDNVNAYITNGHYRVDGLEEYSRLAQAEKGYRRNFFCYAMFKVAPLAFQPSLYNGGAYNAANAYALAQTRNGVSKSTGLNGTFMDTYAVLCNLKNITQVTDEKKNTFLMMSNDTPHSPMLLQEPGYTPAVEVDNTSFDAGRLTRPDGQGGRATLWSENQMTHYHVNMAALLKLGEWFDYLRANDVYDNTRIIIVSDHAWALWQDHQLVWDIDNPQSEGGSPVDLAAFNCMMLVKDFGSKGFATDETLMTNADTPTLAMEGLIENPVNPFTGKEVKSEQKEGVEHEVVVVKYFNPLDNNGETFLPGDRFTVHDDVRKRENWKYLGYY